MEAKNEAIQILFFPLSSIVIPNTMTVVMPARIEAEGAKLKLQNKFSVALQTLPIQAKFSMKMKNRAARFHAKMFEVKKYSDQVHSSPDYFVCVRTLKVGILLSPYGHCIHLFSCLGFICR